MMVPSFEDGVFLDVVPAVFFRRSLNTTPQTRYNPVTGRTKITGLTCHECHAEARRGQLSPTLLRAMEA